MVKDIYLFARKLFYKSLYVKQENHEPEVAPNLKAADFKALLDLNLLLEENAPLDETWEGNLEEEESNNEDGDLMITPLKKFKRKSHNFSLLMLFIKQTSKEIEGMSREDTH